VGLPKFEKTSTPPSEQLEGQASQVQKVDHKFVKKNKIKK